MSDNEARWEEEEDGSWYYYYSDGTMATGWMFDSSDWYYFYGDGKMATGWIKYKGDWYYLYSAGSMARNGPIPDSTNNNEFDLDNSTGKMVNGTGWLHDGITGDWYYYSDGSMTYSDTVGGYHLDSSGKMLTGTGWQESDGRWYYLKDDSSVATDWLYNQGNWYYLYPQGSMAEDTTVDGYHVSNDGKWISNWVSENLSSTQEAAKTVLDNQTVVSLTESDETKDAFAAVNFEKDENGVYHTSQPDCWQYPGGYCDLYDDVFNVASSMDKLKYPFKVGDTEYIIWMWKGDYLNFGAGGEVGIYDNKHSVPSMNIGEVSTPAIDNIPGLYEVSKDNALNMTLHASIDGITTIFDWDPGEPNWWITGWNPKFQNVAQENIVLSGTIDLSDHDDLWEAFSSEHKEDEHLTFHPDTHIVDFKWQ